MDFIDGQYSKRFFKYFADRLPDRRRGDVPEMLEKYGLKKYDVIELLKKTGGRQPSVHMELVWVG